MFFTGLDSSTFAALLTVVLLNISGSATETSKRTWTKYVNFSEKNIYKTMLNNWLSTFYWFSYPCILVDIVCK